MLQKFNTGKGMFIALGLLFLVYSCRKNFIAEEIDPSQNDPNKNVEINLAKDYYNKLVKEQGRQALSLDDVKLASGDKSSTGSSKKSPNLKYALFNKAYVSQTVRSRIVEVPVAYDRRISKVMMAPGAYKTSTVSDRRDIFRYSFDRLVIYTNKKTGVTVHRFISYIPDINYLKRHKFKIKHNQINKLDSDFTGFIEYKKWDGTRLYYLQYVNGRRVKVLKTHPVNKTKTIAKSGQAAMTMSSAEFCWTEIIEEWGESCISAGPEGEDDECTPYLIGVEEVEHCEEIPDPCDFGDCDETGDPCIDWGDCFDDPEPPVADPDIVITWIDRALYPTLANVIDNLYNKVKTNSKLMNALKDFTHMSEQQILANLVSGEGPTLMVLPLPSGSAGYGAYNPATNILFIDPTAASNANFYSESYSTALELFITCVVLHEFIHFGEDTTQIYLPYEGQLRDVGFQFENDYYGGKVDFNFLTGEIKYLPL